jgi:hypothetical protein
MTSRYQSLRTKGFQSHHKEDCVLHAHAHVAVELSVLAITGIYKLFMPSKLHC